MTLQQLKYVVTVAKHKSMNRAAAQMFVSQPSLSGAVKDLEEEIGITLFSRTNRGVTITLEGEEFLGYARQMMDQYHLMEERFITKAKEKKKFSVSMQHYTFAVQAFIQLAKTFGMEQYEFAIHETKTYEVIENVKTQKSEIGVLYRNEFNKKILNKIFSEHDVEFHSLFFCDIFVYLWKYHPLAQQTKLEFGDLEEYPCLSFEQGEQNSFYFSEEVFATSEYHQIVKVNDRSTMLNLMVGLNGYTLCSGILCEALNGEEFVAVPLVTQEKMEIGYINKRKMPLSKLAKLYIETLTQFENQIM